MAATSMSDAELVKRMARHPELRRRMESLLLTVEDEAGELKLADDAELRIIEEMRRTGRAALQEWADGQVEKAAQELCQSTKACNAGKKNCAGTPPWAT
jgi:hypothetical protein